MGNGGVHHPGSWAERLAWFPDDVDRHDDLEWLRCPDGFECPRCDSAKGLQSVLELGSYQTASTILHEWRAAMVRPGRELLARDVEVDETLVGGAKPGRPCRCALGKALVGVAVEEPRELVWHGCRHHRRRLTVNRMRRLFAWVHVFVGGLPCRLVNRWLGRNRTDGKLSPQIVLAPGGRGDRRWKLSAALSLAMSPMW